MTYDSTTVKVEVQTPFNFCEKCNRMVLEPSRAYLWADSSPIDWEYYCANAYICRNAIELYKRDENNNL